MSLFEKIISQVRKWFQPSPYKGLDVEILEEFRLVVQEVADKQQRPVHEAAQELLTTVKQAAAEPPQGDLNKAWDTLTVREQQVAALICLGKTNGEIAYRLHLSVPTVKTYATGVFKKYQVRNRNELKILLDHWDFTGWE